MSCFEPTAADFSLATSLSPSPTLTAKRAQIIVETLKDSGFNSVVLPVCTSLHQYTTLLPNNSHPSQHRYRPHPLLLSMSLLHPFFIITKSQSLPRLLVCEGLRLVWSSGGIFIRSTILPVSVVDSHDLTPASPDTPRMWLHHRLQQHYNFFYSPFLLFSPAQLGAMSGSQTTVRPRS